MILPAYINFQTMTSLVFNARDVNRVDMVNLHHEACIIIQYFYKTYNKEEIPNLHDCIKSHPPRLWWWFAKDFQIFYDLQPKLTFNSIDLL